MIKYFSSFTGIGGFELGIIKSYVDISDPEKRLGKSGRMDVQKHHALPDEEQMGVQPLCVGFSEVNKYAIEVYQKHFPRHINYGDITKINEKDLPDFDFFFGGFPCQAFSVAGLRRGFNDTRGTLFFDIARILREKQPRLLLLENVKGLLSHDNGKTFTTIVATLTELGYDLQWQVLNSKDFGVPQNRERIYIVGHLRGESRPEVFPFGTVGEKADEIRVASHKQRGNSSDSEGEDGWPTERREVSNAIDANYFKGIDNHKQRTLITLPKLRRLTPLECERLQGFPDNWTEGLSDTQRYKCVGNAVTVNVIAEIAKRML